VKGVKAYGARLTTKDVSSIRLIKSRGNGQGGGTGGRGNSTRGNGSSKKRGS
jgi:hypothetical protein